MKKSILITIFLSITFGLFSQNIDVSFHPKDGNTKIDSVLVTNQNTGQKVKLSGSETLILVRTATGNIPIQIGQKTGYVYPNPCWEYANVLFSTIKSEVVELNLYNISGQLLTREVKSLKKGTHNFLLKFPIAGVYYISVLKDEDVQSYQVVYTGMTNQSSHIIYVSSEQQNSISEINSLKNATTDITINYSEGDIIQYAVYSGKNAIILSDSPTETKTYTVPFYECMDADHNNYKVVQIGTQLWMAENLKTTKYINGKSIPNVTQDSKWNSLTKGAYCYYVNDANYANTYGNLYNWYAVDDGQIIAPAGWHIPSDDEWKQLEITLGMTQEQADYSCSYSCRGTDQGAQMKATFGWDNNGNGTNTSNFNALPGGCRQEDGFFNIIQTGYWWSFSEDDTYKAWNRDISYADGRVQRSPFDKRAGLSVRCVFDSEASTSNLPPKANFTVSSIYFTKGQSIQFKDISINLPTKWLWDFGDNTSSTSQNPSHTYNASGNYTISLTAYNSCGNTAKTMNIPVKEATETVTDIDGNVYHTVVIGSQTWMVENLKTTRYRNGDQIPYFPDIWGSGAYGIYKDDDKIKSIYGCLYNWYAVNDDRNIAPEGWHIPSDAEWEQLEIASGLIQIEFYQNGSRGYSQGTKMKATLEWSNNCPGTNTSGFTALPGGYYVSEYFNIGNIGYWWSSTEYDSSNARYVMFKCNNTYSQDVYNSNESKWTGKSVRLIKD
jgi:uncharacterized protein (TIGR02145 family)